MPKANDNGYSPNPWIEEADMRCKIQMVMETNAGEAVLEVACFERETQEIEAVGLTLAEAKALLLGIQQALVGQQAAEYLGQHRNCKDCGKALLSKGEHPVLFRTLFGNIELKSPRLFHCECQPHETRSFSPLAGLLGAHTAPERLYLETKWAAQVSFDMAAKLLADVLPLEGQANAASIRNHLHQVAKRSEAELGDEQPSFIDGCPVRLRRSRSASTAAMCGSGTTRRSTLSSSWARACRKKAKTNASASSRPMTGNPSGVFTKC
jgi:hypothetical protein